MSVHTRPVPPASRQDAWGISGKSIADITGKSLGDISFKANPVVQFNVGARQRPQSAIASVNRKPFGQNSNADRSEVRITWEPTEPAKRPTSQQDDALSRHQNQRITQNQMSYVPPLDKAQLQGANLPMARKPEQNTVPAEGKDAMEGRQEFTGSSAAGGVRKRPISAMANMSRGTPSAQEKSEIEELKQEIIDITRKAATLTKDGEKRVSVAETEQILRRYVCTSDASQVHITKSALLALILQRQEDFQRGVLAEFESAGDKEKEKDKDRDKDKDKDKDGQQGMGRWGVMVELADRAREFQGRLGQSAREAAEAKSTLEAAQREAKKVREERDLLRAALAQASKDRSGGLRRPMSAPKSRTASKPLQAAPGPPEGCGECEAYEERVEALRAQLRAAEEAREELQARVELLEKERADAARPRAEEARPQSQQHGISPAEYAAVQKKLLDAEALLESAQANAAKEKAEKAKLLASIKALEERVKALEKEAAEAKAKASTLENKLNDATLTLKANGESSDGAVAREKELLKQIELLTKEMTEARKEGEKKASLCERLEKELAKAKAAADKLRQQLEDDRVEADGIEKRLIAQMRELQAKITSVNKELVAKTAEVSDLEGQVQRLRQQMVALQDEISRLKTAAANPNTEETTQLRREVAGLEARVKELGGQVGALQKEKQRAEEEALLLRRRLEDQDRGFEEQLEEALAARDRELNQLKRSLAGTADLRKQGEAERAELESLRAQYAKLEKELEWEKGKLAALSSSEVALRVLKDDLARAREALAKGEAELRESQGTCGALERKLQATMQRLETADLKLLQMEGDREETRAVENGFKIKMKALYDKRVAELEAMQQELQQQKAQQPPDAASSLGRGSDGARSLLRPATASASGSMRRR